MDAIEMSTMDFVGALSDVIPFASTDVDEPTYNCVRIEWDGEAMYTLASNRNQHVRYRWDDFTDRQPDHTPFSVRVSLADAKHAVSAFKLPNKLGHARIQIRVSGGMSDDGLHTVKLSRAGSEGSWSPLTMHLFGRGAPTEGEAPEVDIHKLIKDVASVDSEVAAIAFYGDRLSNFGKVRNHGAVEFRFTGTETQAVEVKIGERFQGVVWPARLERHNTTDILRTGSGLLLGVGGE